MKQVIRQRAVPFLAIIWFLCSTGIAVPAFGWGEAIASNIAFAIIGVCVGALPLTVRWAGVLNAIVITFPLVICFVLAGNIDIAIMFLGMGSGILLGTHHYITDAGWRKKVGQGNVGE